MATIVETLHTISDAEENLANVVRDMLYLRDQGALSTRDIQSYNVLRTQLYGAQLALYGQIIAVLRGMSLDSTNAALRQIPMPQLWPALTPSPVQPGVSSLGNPIVIVGGGITLSIPVWAVVVVAIIAALAIVAVVIALTSVITSAQEIDANTQRYATFLHTRRLAFAACRARGDSVPVCVAAMNALLPTPGDALPGDPKPPDWTAIAKYLAIGSVAAVAVLGLITIMPFAMRAGASAPRTQRRYTVGPEDEE